MNKEKAVLKTLNNRQALFVDGKPFIALSVQLNCDDCFTPEGMDYLLPHARKMGCNTVQLLLYWREVEPEEGRFDFSSLQHLLEEAEKNELKIVLNWFGAYKNLCLFYAPDYVKEDTGRFPRIRYRDGQWGENCACPLRGETLARDQEAVSRVMAYLREHDRHRTVIALQIENEIGVLGTDRCYCPACNAEFEQEHWPQRYQEDAADAFSATRMAAYVEEIAKALKEIYPLPLFINAILPRYYEYFNPVAGTPSPARLPIYQRIARHLDFIAPDIYQQGYKGFHLFCELYTQGNNPLYIAEHASGKDSRAEINVVYAVGKFAAIGFDPWALDCPYPAEYDQPLVNPADGRWSGDAYELKASYDFIRQAMIPIAKAQNTDTLDCFVQEPQDTGCRLVFGGVYLTIQYINGSYGSRGLVVQLAPDEFLFAGMDFQAAFADRHRRRYAIETVDKGYYLGEEWHHVLYPRREDPTLSSPFTVIGPGVYRVKINAEM